MTYYVVDQEKFYGPLDLLLYLVEKDQLDIIEISIAALADQFVQHVESIQWRLELEEITDFLMMATVLLRLKAKMLLPLHQKITLEDAGEEEGMEAETQLIERILRYKHFKTAAQFFSTWETQVPDHRYFREPVEKSTASIGGRPEHLLNAMQQLKQHQALIFQFTLPLSEVKVEQKIRQILHFLELRNGIGSFSQLISFYSPNPNEIAGLFLGLLELARAHKVQLQQTGYLEDIAITYVKGIS